MTASAATHTRVRVGEPIKVRNLTVIPLFGDQSAHKTYLTLDEALAAGTAEVSEISEAGSVPELRLRNRGDLPVLLLDGEELTGAKQNRVLNLSLLATPKAETLIPVSCIEAGRWQFKSRAFQTTERAQHAKGRSMKMANVSLSLSRDGGARSDQSEVWTEISRKSSAMSASSPTSALSDVFDTYREDLDAYVSGVKLPDGATGAAFAINGRVLGLELFDTSDTCSKLIGKLIRSWSLDAIEQKDAIAVSSEGDLRADAEKLAAHVLGLSGERAATAGLGEQVRFEDTSVVGASLAHDGRLVHSVAFVREGEHAH